MKDTVLKDTILIVEDDRDIREVVTILLGREGFKTLQAATGEKALEEISQNPDLIILDVMLPGIDGYEVCRGSERFPSRRCCF